MDGSQGMILAARDIQLTFPRPALVMGIVNVTPDSFSDGGKFMDPDKAVAYGLEMVGQGAEILDIGGESTRPDATPVPQDEELRRVIPVIERLAAQSAAIISIDTRKPGVAREAIKAGAKLVNDTAAHVNEEEMWSVLAESGAGYVCMHALGTPQTMQIKPEYRDPIWEILNFFGHRFEQMTAAGVHAERIIFDPGFGFGKTARHNLQLLASLRSFKIFNRPLLVGISRKSFMGTLLGLEVNQRLAASVAGACWAVEHGANILRVHDVAATVQAARLVEAVVEARGQTPIQ